MQNREIKLAINCPINSLGYGIYSIYIILNIISDVKFWNKQKPSIDIIPIGSPDIENLDSIEEQYYKWFFTNKVEYNIKDHIVTRDYAENQSYSNVIYIWHPGQLTDNFTPKGFTKKLGITFFERDRLTGKEIEGLSKVDVVCSASNWATKILKQHKLNTGERIIPEINRTINYSANDPDYQTLKATIAELSKNSQPDVIYSGGKWEVRKNQKALLDTFSSRNKQSIIIGQWDNPFTGGLSQPINYLVTSGWQLKKQGKIYNNIGYIYSKNNCHVILLPRISSYVSSVNVLDLTNSYISYSSAEGLNLHAIEAINNGIDSVHLSDNTAHQDIADLAKITERIKCSIEPAIDNLWFKGEGNWYPVLDTELKKYREDKDISLKTHQISSTLFPEKSVIKTLEDFF